ncbi:MAG: glycosyltransferase family 2 protein [Planctomycetota bacterium]
MEKSDLKNSIRISAVIPAYNAESYIARTIESVLQQTYPAAEIIVVDDGSTDKTAQVVGQFGDKVRLIQQENAGECGARNTGVRHAAFSWIAFLDADDEWLPQKLQLQVECIRQHPLLVWVSSNYERCLCGTNRCKPHMSTQKTKKFFEGKTCISDFFQAFILDVYGCSDTMLVKKDVLLEAGLFRQGQTRAGDMDMWWRIAFRYPQFGYVHKPLAVYHLGIPGCASVTFNNWRIYSDMIERNLREAEHCGRLETFRPAATYMLRKWLRSMLFDGQKEGIRFMLKQFNCFLSPGYRFLMWLLTCYPALTVKCLKLSSRIIRQMPVNRKLVRPPS